jgi:hypothetical protein
MAEHYRLIVDTPEQGILRLTLEGSSGGVVGQSELPISGHVDNLLLTAVDELLKKSNLDRSALTAVQLGAGIDKNSSLCRIVQSFAAAVRTASGGSGGAPDSAAAALPRGGSDGAVY